MSLASFKDYISNTNTIKNPLDTIFPNTRKKITGKEPPKIVKEPYIEKIKNSVKEFKTKVGSLVFFGIVGFVIYSISKNN